MPPPRTDGDGDGDDGGPRTARTVSSSSAEATGWAVPGAAGVPDPRSADAGTFRTLHHRRRRRHLRYRESTMDRRLRPRPLPSTDKR